MMDKRVKGIARDQLINLLISRFYNMEWYHNHAPHPFLLDLEENREIRDFILEDVVIFCMNTDVCKQLNLSVRDLMQFSLPQYSMIKEIVRKDNERKAKIVEDQAKDIQRRERDFAGVSNAGKRRS